MERNTKDCQPPHEVFYKHELTRSASYHGVRALIIPKARVREVKSMILGHRAAERGLVFEALPSMLKPEL